MPRRGELDKRAFIADTMKLTKKAQALLAQSFLWKGKIGWSRTDTNDGTWALWAELERHGLVINLGKKSPLGHRFSIEITEAGEKFLAS